MRVTLEIDTNLTTDEIMKMLRRASDNAGTSSDTEELDALGDAFDDAEADDE